MTQEEKVKELYNELKPKCQAEGLNLCWEIQHITIFSPCCT